MRLARFATLVGTATLLGTGLAQAQPPGMGPPDTAEGRLGLYLGIGLEQFRIQAEGSDGGTEYDLTTRPVGLTGRVGYNFFEWLSLEGHASVGIHDDSNSGTVGATQERVRNGETELKHHVGIAAVPEHRFVFGGTTVITVFGMLGYNSFEFEGEAQNDAGLGPAETVDFTLDDSGEYWGGGLRLDGEAGGLRLQYTRYFDDSGLDIDGYGISVNIYF